jgi:RNA polymerase sigma factor (sigma-70 family)/anti-anti-sigma factor
LIDLSKLIPKAQAGDLKSFEQIVNQYQKKVYAFALGKLCSRVDAEEIVQETWLRVFVNIKNLKNPGSLAAWIFSICSNCINYFLRKQAQKPSMYDADVEELGIEAEEENGWYEYADLLGLVVNQLKSHHQDVIKLRYFSGLKNREIGAVLGISSNLVKSRLHEARVKIKELLPGLYQDVRLSQYQMSDLKEKIMNKVELVQRGSHILCRLSLEDQVRFCEIVAKGQRFDESLLQEIGSINGGLEFIKECDARLQVSELADILTTSDESTSKRILTRLDELHDIFAEAVKRNMIISRFAEKTKDEALTVRFQRVESDEQCLILYLIGYIDAFNAAISRKRLFRALEGGYTRLILHCGGFNYISSTGVGLFADLFKTLKSRGGSLIILKMNP